MLVIAVKEIERATSPLAIEANILDVAPPGTAAISITPTANSGGKDGKNIIIKHKARIGKIKIWDNKPIITSLDWEKILVKSEIFNPSPKENMIKAIARGKNISDIMPILYFNIRF